MAQRFFINGGVDNNFSSISNWSDTSGGTGGFSVPTAADNAFFDVNSPNCVLTANVATLTLNFTNYSNSITGAFTITVSGAATLSPTMTIGATVGLTLITTATHTSNGKQWTGNLTFRGITTHTLADAWSVGGTLTIGLAASTTSTTINGNSISVSGSLTILGTSSTHQGTTTINLVGTGNWTSTLGSNGLRNNITINTAGTITISGVIRYNTGTITYTAGTVVTTGSTLNLTASTTLNTSGMSWNNITCLTAIGVHNLNSILTINGILSINIGTTFNGSDILLSGNLNNVSTGNLTGTSTLRLVGNTTWLHSSTGITRCNVEINTVGTVTFGAQVRFDSATLTYTAGTIVTTTNTFFCTASTTFQINQAVTPFQLRNLTLSGATTITINNHHLYVSSTLTHSVGSSITYAGNETWTAVNFTILNTASNFITFQPPSLPGVNYACTNFTALCSDAARTTLRSATPGAQALFQVINGGTYNVGYVNATDIDSSLGETIYSFDGVLTNTTNWNLLAPSEISSEGTKLIFFN